MVRMNKKIVQIIAAAMSMGAFFNQDSYKGRPIRGFRGYPGKKEAAQKHRLNVKAARKIRHEQKLVRILEHQKRTQKAFLKAVRKEMKKRKITVMKPGILIRVPFCGKLVRYEMN